jgi:hypothetical protein
MMTDIRFNAYVTDESNFPSSRFDSTDTFRIFVFIVFFCSTFTVNFALIYNSLFCRQCRSVCVIAFLLMPLFMMFLGTKRHCVCGGFFCKDADALEGAEARPSPNTQFMREHNI